MPHIFIIYLHRNITILRTNLIYKNEIINNQIEKLSFCVGSWVGKIFDIF